MCCWTLRCVALTATWPPAVYLPPNLDVCLCLVALRSSNQKLTALNFTWCDFSDLGVDMFIDLVKHHNE